MPTPARPSSPIAGSRSASSASEGRKTGVVQHETVHGLSSLPFEHASAERILALVRGHWSIENRVHYVRDVSYDEDRCRVHTGHLAQPRLPGRHLHRKADSITSPIDTARCPEQAVRSSNRLRLDYPPESSLGDTRDGSGAPEPRPLRPASNQNASPTTRRHHSQRILPPRRVLCAPHHRSWAHDANKASNTKNGRGLELLINQEAQHA